jgi:hypothetical protein
MIDHAEPNANSLRQLYERFAEWASPTTSFEFEVAHPIDDCAERLRQSKRTGFQSWFSGSVIETEVQPDGDGNYQFTFSRAQDKTKLKADGFLTNNGERETLVEGLIQHSTAAWVNFVFFVISVVVIFGFGMAALRSLPLLGVLICLPFAVIISAAGLAWNRSLMITAQRDGIGKIMSILVMDEQPAKKKKRMM